MSAAPIWKPPAGPLSEDQRIAGIRELLKGASPGLRRAALSLVLHEDLEKARAAYLRAHEAEEAYKADLIRSNGEAVKGAAERLDAALDVLWPILDVMVLAIHATGLVEDRVEAVRACMAQLGTVCGPWRDVRAGLERGVGLTGYDTPDNVAAVQLEVLQIHERWVARSQKSA